MMKRETCSMHKCWCDELINQSIIDWLTDCWWLNSVLGQQDDLAGSATWFIFIFWGHSKQVI